ncbi:MAG TPA: monomethylamine:corrinoid methyltransferase [Chloroflexi bacterium]|nr:monomethylamine:corrinoid methyltransferase [Chloroflexota bacterium]
MLLSYHDIMDRALSGPYLNEEEWDLQKIAMTTARLVEKYKLTWDPGVIVPDDPGLVDAVFEAGLELAKEVGVYSRSTERIVEFEPGELEEGMRLMPQTLVMGEGKDARTLYARKIMDDRLPLVWAGSPGTPFPEELFLPSVLSWAQEPIVDMVTCGTLMHVDGREIRTADPIEIIATRRELQYMRQALRRVGRPGMGMLAAQSSVSELGDLAVAHPDYLRPCDSHLVPMLNELKLDHRNIARAVNSIEYGMRNASLPCVIVGGLGGDAPGSAVVNVASFIVSSLAFLADYHLCHPIHVRHIATSTRSVMWVESVVEQAFARNAPCIIVSDIYPKSGALTRELLYETAANAIAITVSGGHLEGCGSADGNLPNATGLEARLMGEVGHAVARQGMTLQEANALILKLLEKYEHVFDLPEGNPGVRFDQAYDMKTLRPIPEWRQMYEEVKAELKEMGLEALG